MAGYEPDALVTVRPFAHQREKDSVTIGDLERQVYLSIPPEGLDILESLRAGHTVAETVHRYQQKHGETPDIDDFLGVLAAEGFVASPQLSAASGDAAAHTPAADSAGAPQAPRWTWSVSWITPDLARRLASWPVLALFGVAIAFSVFLEFRDPSLIKNATILLFPKHFAALTWATVALSLVGVVIHELGHLVAARAVGVPASIGFGNRLYYIVAETHMSGIWLHPRRQRYVAFLAGPLIDLLIIALLIILLAAHRAGFVGLPWAAAQLVAALIFVTLIRFVWQTFFFIRTDFYFTFATLFNCKNLMADTETFLRNLLARLRRSGDVVDQSGIPRREMWVIRCYSVVWLAGRVMALGALFLIMLPLLAGYVVEGGRYLTGRPSLFGSVDFATVVALAFIFQGGGIMLWARGLYKGWKASRSVEAAPVSQPAAAP
ncbi:MAG: site-2 protease family protein [Micromonosporaceae bacterium]